MKGVLIAAVIAISLGVVLSDAAGSTTANLPTMSDTCAGVSYSANSTSTADASINWMSISSLSSSGSGSSTATTTQAVCTYTQGLNNGNTNITTQATYLQLCLSIQAGATTAKCAVSTCSTCTGTSTTYSCTGCSSVRSGNTYICIPYSTGSTQLYICTKYSVTQSATGLLNVLGALAVSIALFFAF